MSTANRAADPVPTARAVGELLSILRDDKVVPEFQPIVDLVSGATVAYEALARGPSDSTLHLPADLFSVARQTGHLDELDWHCRVSALRAALRIGIRPPFTVFLNVEPEVLGEPPTEMAAVLGRATGGLRVIVELTERSLLATPAALLGFVEAIRRRGWGVAVDDIGAHPHSLAMLAVIEPDVVKIDQALVRGMPVGTAAALISGVQTYCRRSDAVVVAEGLETPDDVATARSIGASYGQGWHLGRPVAIDEAPAPAARAIPMVSPRPHLPTRRLISLLTRSGPPQSTHQERVIRLTNYVIDHAIQLGPATLVMACVQTADAMSGELRAGFARLAREVAYVGLLGVDVPPDPVPGAIGHALSPSDPLTSEWVIAVVGLQECLALVAADLGDDADLGADRRYELALTYDPRLVVDVARALLTRVE